MRPFTALGGSGARGHIVLDGIGLTQQYDRASDAYEKRQREEYDWL